MAWGRLALIQAAGENSEALEKTAKVFGFAPIAQQQEPSPPEPDENAVRDDEGKPDLSSSKKVSHRPPARFLRLNKLQRLENPDDSKPGYLDDPKMRLQRDKAPTGTYRFALPRQLMPMSRLLPFLHNSLGQARAVGKLDHRRVTQLFAQGKAIRRLPCLPRQRWPQRLQIIVDTTSRLEPYWTDFAFIIERLKKLLGAETVTAIRFDEDSFGAEPSYCIVWPTLDNHEWRRWQAPAADEAILLLSDLGVTDTHPAARINWQRLLKRLQAHPAPMLTLSPVAQSPLNPALCRQARPNPLNDHYALPRHPMRNGYTLTEPAEEKINTILALLSSLPVIDAGLLRRLRDELQWGGSELESQIWNHPDIRQISLGIRLQESVAENYRQQYQQKLKGTDQANKLWQIVEEHHGKAFEGLRQLEVLNQCVMEGVDNVEMREYFQSLCATVAQEAPDSVLRKALLLQCRTIMASRPQSIWHTALGDLAHDLFAMTYADEIRSGRWPDKLETGFDHARLHYLLDERARHERIHWQIIQIGGQGQFIFRRADLAGVANSTIVTLEPIAAFEAQPAFPPTLQFAFSDDGVREVMREGQAFTLNSVVVTIRTTLQRLELESISKPAWATHIWRDSYGLCAGIPWLGVAHPVLWQIGDENNAGHWAWPPPFGEDQHGLYADLKLHGITQRFRWIIPGEFLMGSPETESKRGSWDNGNETQHAVTLTEGYWLADTACTQALWQAVMGANPAHFKDNPNFKVNPNNPVETVSWDDVQHFITKLNELVPNLNARLPTEAQWEYACRAGTTTPFAFGENITPEQVNYNGNYPYAGGEEGLFRRKTVPVKSLPANPWGLYEMHGNVWEWCRDWYGRYPSRRYGGYSSRPATDPVGPPEGSARVLRGGSWLNYARSTRSANRYRYNPAVRNDDFGFRLALGQMAAGQRQGRERFAEAEPAQASQDKNVMSRLLDWIKAK